MDIKTSNFRTDINGLRAWAVVLVILYHFGVFGFSGGFVGVDIFFVISGYLMTGIIARGLTGGLSSDKQFSVINFYTSRAKRILPALIVLCAFILALGWFVLLPQEYHTLGAYVVSALGFYSNIKFSRESGYFDPESHENFLLHTWSLSVEWQFYLILPLAMIVAWKLRPRVSSLKWMITLGAGLSLYWSIIITPNEPVVAFYFLKTRAWEMLAGGIVYLWFNNVAMTPSFRKTIEGFGFVLIVASIVIFDQRSQWPGWHALVPVIGTGLVLIAARQDSWLTKTKLAQWLGSSSYSLYLWHWPITVLIVFLNLRNDSLAIIAGLILTLLLGWLSYRYVEQSTRKSLSSKGLILSVSLLLAGVIIIGGLGYLIRWQDGFPGRISSQTQTVLNEANNKNPRLEACATQAYSIDSKENPVPNCRYGNGGTIKAVMIGDSHSSSLVTSLKTAFGSGDILQWTANACPLAIGINNKSERHKCNDFLVWAIKEAKSLPSNVPVVLVNRFSAYLYGPNEVDRHLMKLVSQFEINQADFNNEHYAENMRRGIIKTVCELSANRQVYIVRPVPEQGFNVPVSMGRSIIFHMPSRVSVTREQYNKRNAFVLETLDLAAEQCGAKILDPVPYLCDEKSCWGDVNGLPIYFDDDHLNERGSQILVPMFRKVANQVPERPLQTVN